MSKLVAFLLLVTSCQAIYVKDWGMDSYINRLAYSTYDVFFEAFEKVTATLNTIYPVEGFFKRVQGIKGPDRILQVEFYNGWLDSLRLDSNRLSTRGALRRFIMTRLHKENTLPDPKAKQEIYMCDACMALVADGFKFAYDANLQRAKNITGKLENKQTLIYSINFKMNLALKMNPKTSKMECIQQLDSITLNLHASEDIVPFDARLYPITGYSFLADYVDKWMLSHFNGTVRQTLQTQMDTAVRRSLLIRDVCSEFLAS